MDPFSTLSSIYDAATQLQSIYDQVKANKEQSKTLNDRVQLIIPHIRLYIEEKLKSKAKQGVSCVTDSTLLSQLERLLHTLESCVKLVDKFTAANWLMRLWGKSDYTKQFADLNAELCLLSTDLQLGLSVKNVFDREADVRDQRADLTELLTGQEEILSAAGRLESGQQELHDHLLSGLSLERQVLDGQQQLQREQLHLKLAAEHQRKHSEAEMMSRRRFQNEIKKALQELQSPSTTHSSTSISPVPTSPKDMVLQIDYSDLEFNPAEPVGSGGFGDVFFGQWLSRDLTVAIKKLRLCTLSKTALAEFNAEVELLASVPRHDHVVGLLGICINPAKQIYLMVLDWMEQGSLFDFLRRSTLPNATPLTIRQKLNLMLQCTKAVNHLHLLRRPIIHGDIKSMNFLLNSHGEIKIGDFGLGRVRTESMSQSKLTQQYYSSGGSIQYQAPELLDGFDSPTKQSDIYALTIVLWEILTCKIPYDRITPERIQSMIPAGKRLPIPSDANLSDDLNSQLKALIEQGWHQQSQQRPTAPQLIQHIKKLIHTASSAPSVSTSTPPLASHPPPTRTLIRIVKRPPSASPISSSAPPPPLAIPPIQSISGAISSVLPLNDTTKAYVDGEFLLPTMFGDLQVDSWRRVKEIPGFQSATVFPNDRVEECSFHDVQEGQLGDTWFLAAVATLVGQPERLKKLFVTDRYAPDGRYSLRLFHNGWQTVVIDDYFPCDTDGRPLFCESRRSGPGILWAMLLEKAYAKVFGGYDEIRSGYIDEAFTDLTGGVSRRLILKSELESYTGAVLFQLLLKIFTKGGLLSAASSSDSANQEGTVAHHDYSIHDVRQVDGHQLLQLRHPCGRQECGDWSEKSSKWTNQLKQQLNWVENDDGAFWISFDDFVKEFKEVHYCTVYDSPEWFEMPRLFGSWTGTGTGLYRTDSGASLDTEADYPQYLLTTHPSESTEVIMVLSQTDTRGTSKNPFRIGIEVYSNHGRRMTRTNHGTMIATNEDIYIDQRDVVLQHTFPPTSDPYTILLSTWNPGEETNFCFRLYSSRPIKLVPAPTL